MTDPTENQKADREIADLLPWYETGRLGAEDRARGHLLPQLVLRPQR